MTAARARRRAIAALAIGLALGAVSSAGIALLLYTGQGFLRAAGLLVSSTLMAVAAGLWGGAPEGGRQSSGGRAGVRTGTNAEVQHPPMARATLPALAPLEPVSTRGRWVALLVTFIVGGLFVAFWSAQPQFRDQAWAGALAVLLVLALPGYAAGMLLAGLHARDHGPGASAVAATSMAGGALGILLAATVLIPDFQPHAIFYAGAALLVVASILDRVGDKRHSASGGPDMTDRVVIVTGAADRGQLGYTIVRAFLESGARVIMSARTDAVHETATELGAIGHVIAVPADLTIDDDVARLIATAQERFDRLDAVINVAGGLSVIATIEDTTPEQWQSEIERNAGTALRLSRAALPMLRASRGTIVNFTSPAASRAPARLAAYSAAKAAVAALTRSLAIEEKTNGVRVNAIAPGIMDTDQNRGTRTDAAKGDVDGSTAGGVDDGADADARSSTDADSAVAAKAVKNTNYVSREDVARVTLFLAGPDSAGITGEVVHVMGNTL